MAMGKPLWRALPRNGTDATGQQPRIAIEINDRQLVTRDFGFYVENRLRAQFGLEGVPLVIDFKGKK